MPIRTLIWGENVHEQKNKIVSDNYPSGMHNQIAKLLASDSNIVTKTATLQEPEHGCTVEALDNTDVLVWWGHAAHGQVQDEIVERIAKRIWEGMGLIVLHSGHFSKIFKRLMGSPCGLTWREAGERERLWVTSPGHPIAKGLPPYFELEMEEMYGEPFSVPEPLETVFVSWFQGGEVFRSGLTYHDDTVGLVLRNAVNWAYNANRFPQMLEAPNVPVDEALEKIEERGPKLHHGREEGFR